MKIESFEMACDRLGLDPEKCLPDVSNMPEKHRGALIAAAKLYIITEASWEGKEPNWNDGDEEKWFPWFDMEVDKNNPSGFRFGVTGYADTYALAGSGSRLCFRTDSEADYHGRQHVELYREMMVIAK